MIELDSPFELQISFGSLIDKYSEIATKPNHFKYELAQKILKNIENAPELKQVIVDLKVIKKYEKEIEILFSELFPEDLTENEVKALAIPFLGINFNQSKRFQKIFKNQLEENIINLRDFSENQFYIMNCCMIINGYFNKPIDFNFPLLCDTIDENGILRHYRVLYNADFLDVLPTEHSKFLTEEEILLLIDNYQDVNLWKKFFPKNSWILKGFGIVNLFDSTTENAVSNLKTNLLKSENHKREIDHLIRPILKSFFKIPDIEFGHIIFDPFTNKLSQPYYSYSLKCFSFEGVENEEEILTVNQLIEINKTTKFLSFANLDYDIYDVKYQKLVLQLRKMGFKSSILAPIINDDGQVLGAIELHSYTKGALNSVNANKIDLIIDFVKDSVQNFHDELQKNVDIIIQKEYSSIHESVYWKFKEEATQYFSSSLNNENYQLKEIVFKDLYPLYGQLDIKGSSEQRNITLINDLKLQFDWLLKIFYELKKKNDLIIFDQKIYEIEKWKEELSQTLKADFEQTIQKQLTKDIHVLLKNFITDGALLEELNQYFDQIESKSGLLYKERKKFDQALTIINKKLAKIIDEKQKEAQKIFPHYYERFKTDGIEHNLYIGQSINPNVKYDDLFLKNLRLWQFKTICEMELEHHKFKNELPFPLEITSLILVFNSPISIRFRMDEKRFDVDGTYNARYEVVKKRIDKSKIKNSNERIVQMGKITIIYSGNSERSEYLEYADYLIHKKMITSNIEEFEVEELQGISGLKALRVEVLHPIEEEIEFENISIDQFLEKHN